ncbi:transcriptional regulator GcvA [Burkholderia gladioli]|uniref:transcriptional regulator GcvA n=1 Tax=Burkholderia gladioli TaxID=28095 RepID=UPI002158DEC1|nr:transcriptional regulator GcvA [Burkholderia gladioli]
MKSIAVPPYFRQMTSRRPGHEKFSCARIDSFFRPGLRVRSSTLHETSLFFDAMAARLPSLNGLKVFECVARHMSFTRAAAELNVTQTAVSHQVRRLEDELGIRLFLRLKERLELTPAGHAYLQGVGLAFEQLRFSTAQLREGRRDNTLGISTVASFAAKWLLPRLGSFRLAHPEVELRIGASTDFVDFLAGGHDAAVRLGHGDWPGLCCDRLMADEILPVCSPRYLSAGPRLAEPADLAHHTLLQVGGVTGDDWSCWLAAAGLSPDLPGSGRMHFDLALLAVQAAIDGHGVCIGRRAYVEDDLRAGRLIAPFDLSVSTGRSFYLVSPPECADSARVRAFRGWLLEAARG